MLVGREERGAPDHPVCPPPPSSQTVTISDQLRDPSVDLPNTPLTAADHTGDKARFVPRQGWSSLFVAIVSYGRGN